MTAAMLKAAQIWPLDPAAYVAHALHRGERAWPETNCYVDLWIEVLHAMGLDPTAALAFTVASDFEGDQWTFFKFPLVDLDELYGVRTEELAIWRSPAEHALEQVARGRIVLMEADAYFLPDVAGTSYHSEHAKTTIAIQAVDLGGERCGYFHNAGYYTVEGEDFRKLFWLDRPWDGVDDHLLPFTEFAKIDRLRRLSDADLAARAVAQLRRHLAARPATNPFVAFGARLAADVERLRGERLADFHLYAFATIRQLGASYEMLATFLRWLRARGEAALEAPAAEFEAIAQSAKVLQFKLARAVSGKKPFSVDEMMSELASRWDAGMAALVAIYGA